MVNRRKGKTIGYRIVLSLIVLLLGMPVHAGASSVALTAAAQTAWGKLVSFADASQAAKLTAQMNSLRSWQSQEDALDAKLEALHYSNEETLTVTKNRIKTIRATQIAALEAKLKKTEATYKPLLDQYSLLTKQISAANAVGSKTLKKLLQMQADLLKPVVALAKADIKARKEELQAEKTAASKTAASIRATLKEIDTVKVQIRAAKSGAQSSKTALNSLLKTFNASVKKPDAQASSSTLASMLTLYSKLMDYKQKNYTCEQKITSILTKAKLQFPSA
ncbi:hypothetical protein [Cohnella fermenti]|uniref:Uncharacterized protein n=1 Tax=Cohnella fermenti TaxID=2565925 RepID=A0A4S4BSN5_9BACL|nr:hypothetical protein [Cohnella fermenti]THF78066.1 hypothetical protein E6C55_15340 [Cohnella fermenti]